MSATPVEAVGPYRLDRLLGKGGMGEVYKAIDQRLDRSVAVKHILPEAAGDPQARKRFTREARTAAQLGHPAIAQVFDVLEVGGDAWIVMELIDGPTLEELLSDGPLDVGLALSYALQIASGLEAAHNLGIVHRDLKTENVMVLPTGHVKILDFGLATPTHVDQVVDLTLSIAGRPLGTPRSMPPEQARGLDVDGRSDLFAFGVLLYELLTGRSPFRAKSFYATLKLVLTHRQPPARRLNPRIPPGLSDLLDQMLEKNPGRRPDSAGAVAEALARIAESSQLYRPPAASGHGGDAAGDATAAGDAPMDGAMVKTLLVSDLVGSTRLVEDLGDRQAAALFRRHDRLARDLLAEHQGLEIEKTDGFLLLFDRPWDAVSYALAYHRALARLSAEAGGTLASRVGIHLGSVILHRNTALDVSRGAKPLEVEGLAKPAAVRLMSLARGAQTLLTRGAYDVARRSATDGDLRWLSHGRYRFEGIARDVAVFEVGVPGMSPLAAPEGSAQVRRVATADQPAADATPSMRPRYWPAPELPAHPYPGLEPYRHPRLLAGRERDLDVLRQRLALPVLVLGLSAVAGAGKSSLLLGGLVPVLRAERRPVAVVRQSCADGVAEELLGQLVSGGPAKPAAPIREGHSTWAGGVPPWRHFVDRIAEVERLAGAAPILVLDAFDEVLRPEAEANRATLGVLLAAAARRRPGIETPPCRWLLAYRPETHGEVLAWLRDLLADARSAGVGGIESLPRDLSQGERFHRMSLPPLAAPAAARDGKGGAARVFRSAIEKPLAAVGADDPGGAGGSPEGEPTSHYPWCFAEDGAERLARAFAEARLARPDAPLTPELQLVLADLLASAGDVPPEAGSRSKRVVEVPENVDGLIERVLADHLRNSLRTAFDSGTGGRTRALVALCELASAVEAGQAGLPADALSEAIGDEVLEALATSRTRLVLLQEQPAGWRWVLADDRMAGVVLRLVEAEDECDALAVDGDLVRLSRFVALETTRHGASQGPAPRLSRQCFSALRDNAETLFWSDPRRAWWLACRRRTARQRAIAWSVAAAAALALAAFGVWHW